MKNKNRGKQTRYLSQAIQLEEAVNPNIIHSTMLMVSMALIGFVVWSAFTNINEIARAPGEIVPYGSQQSLQHFEGGIVTQIHVKDGDIVEKDQVLITLDSKGTKADLIRARALQNDLEMRAERLRAFSEGRDPDFSKFTHLTSSQIQDQQKFFDAMLDARNKEINIIREQLNEKKQSIKLLHSDLITAKSNRDISESIYKKREALNARGYATEMQLLSDRQTLTQAKGKVRSLYSQISVAKTKIEEYENRIQSLSAQHNDEALEKLSSIEVEKSQNAEVIQKLIDKKDRLELRAASKGIIKGLTLNTIGAVIKPGETVLEIVPLEKPLEVSVKISPKDIGHMKPGQPVEVKFSSFDFSRYGTLTGKIEHISATTFSSNNGERYYEGRVSLPKNYVGSSKHNIIMPGMTVMADVITGEKTILEYMLKPIHISLTTAFTER